MARKRVRKPGPGGNLDYVPHGSDQHAGLLGLRKAEKDDEPQRDGWALQDVTMYRPEYLVQILRQKVSELVLYQSKLCQSGAQYATVLRAKFKG